MTEIFEAARPTHFGPCFARAVIDDGTGTVRWGDTKQCPNGTLANPNRLDIACLPPGALGVWLRLWTRNPQEHGYGPDAGRCFLPAGMVGKWTLARGVGVRTQAGPAGWNIRLTIKWHMLEHNFVEAYWADPRYVTTPVL